MNIVREGSTLVLTGHFDVRSTMEVRAAIYDHMDATPRDVVIDLSGVTTVDLTALKVLAVATRHAERQGRRLRLLGCGPAVRRLLHMSHIIRLVDIQRERVPV